MRSCSRIRFKGGERLSIKDNEGNIPLHSTFEPEIAKILVKNGAKPNAENDRYQIENIEVK